jgi:enoyl-CoA hydratase/carnithine racemase
MPFLNIARDGAIWTLTMNQPETRNALTGNTAVDEFVQVCDEIRRDASVKAVILTGAGPIFSSGGNVKDMQRFFDDAHRQRDGHFCRELRARGHRARRRRRLAAAACRGPRQGRRDGLHGRGHRCP